MKIGIKALIITLATKILSKLLPVLIKFAKVLKVGKIGLVGASFASYAYLFTWQFAIMILLLLFVHESGHIWAMKRCGMKTKGIYFIPFLGAAAVANEEFPSRGAEAYIAIMGPIWGFFLSILVGAIYFITDNALFAAAAGWMAMVNLFNLLPINPLDGGRIVKSITFSISSKLGFIFLSVGTIIMVIFMLYTKLILFVILIFVSMLELFFEYKTYNTYNKEYKEIKCELEQRLSECPPEIVQAHVPEIVYAHAVLSELNEEIKKLTTIPMKIGNIIISAISYVIVIVVLWALMYYMNDIPEVEIARKLFM